MSNTEAKKETKGTFAGIITKEGIVIEVNEFKSLSKDSKTEFNALIAKRIKRGDKSAMADFLSMNRCLIYNIANTVSWKQYSICTKEDVVNSASMCMMEAMNHLLEIGYEMVSSADFYKLYMDTVSGLKAYLSETYYDGGIKMSYSTKKRKAKEGTLPVVIHANNNGLSQVTNNAYAIRYHSTYNDGVKCPVHPESSFKTKVEKQQSQSNVADPVLDTIVENDEHEALKAALDMLDNEQKAIIKARYGLDGQILRIREVAEMLSMTQSAAYRNEQQALSKLAKMM